MVFSLPERAFLKKLSREDSFSKGPQPPFQWKREKTKKQKKMFFKNRCLHMSFKHTPPSGLTWEVQHVNGVFALKTRKEEKEKIECPHVNRVQIKAGKLPWTGKIADEWEQFLYIYNLKPHSRITDTTPAFHMQWCRRSHVNYLTLIIYSAYPVSFLSLCPDLNPTHERRHFSCEILLRQFGLVSILL